MGATLDRVRAFLAHPAPGLVFPAHDGAGAPERAYATPHTGGARLGWRERRTLKRLTRENVGALGPLVDMYSAMNGAAFCRLWDSLNHRAVPALTLLPVREWDRATRPWVDGNTAGLMRGCESYTKGEWRVIGKLPSEGQSLVVFFGGEHKGKGLAGRMFCIGLDGCLGHEDELAPDFGAFIAQFTADPAAVLDRIGFTWMVKGPTAWYGDPVGAYVADVRGHPSLREWPG